MQHGVAGELGKARLLVGRKAGRERSEGNTGASSHTSGGQLQISIGVVVQEIRETRLQELALDCDCRAIDPKRLLLEENRIQQLRSEREDQLLLRARALEFPSLEIGNEESGN